VELLKMVEETLDALFEMMLPVPLEMVRSLVEGIDTVMQRYSPSDSASTVPAIINYLQELPVRHPAGCGPS
jgi:hypothetical protein